MAGLGAIVKSAAGSLAKQQGKKIATDKLMGRKPKALPAAGQTGASKKDTAMNMVSSMASKSPMQGPEIPASKQTINVSAQTVGGDVGSGGGGSAIVKQVQDISVVVATIADSMKGNLVLKEKAQSKARKAAERDKRAAQESETEKPKSKKPDDGSKQRFKVPKIGFLEGIFGFLTKFFFGIAIMKLIDLADSPIVKGLITAIKGVGKVLKFIFGPPLAGAGLLLQGLISFVDIGYKIVDGMEKIVTNIFGEEGAEKFRIFMENLKTLINSFVIFQIIKGKFGKAISQVIKNTFRFIKNFARRAIANLGRLVGPGVRKGVKGILSKGKGLLSKGAGKVGGFASKIFGKAAKFVSPALKGALPAVKGFAGRIPILGPVIVGIVSLMSGEPAAQALFKAAGAALGGALGTFIPIPILGTLIGETIGVFVGDLLYELIMGGGIDAVGQKLKDTFKTIFKGGKAVFNFFKSGFVNFINNFKEKYMVKLPKVLGVQVKLPGIGDTIPNLLQLYNPLAMVPLLVKSFFGGEEGGETTSSSITGTISANQETFGGKGGSTYETKAGKDAEEISKETTYESGEGNAVFIPVPTGGGSGGGVGNRTNRRGSGMRTRSIKRNIDEVALSMYAGK